MTTWGIFTGEGIFEYAIEAYSAVDPWFYPILMIGIVGYIYGCMNSATSAIIAILITFGLFATTTSIFEQTSEIIILLYLITIVGLTFLVVTLLTKRSS